MVKCYHELGDLPYTDDQGPLYKPVICNGRIKKDPNLCCHWMKVYKRIGMNRYDMVLFLFQHNFSLKGTNKKQKIVVVLDHILLYIK